MQGERRLRAAAGPEPARHPRSRSRRASSRSASASKGVPGPGDLPARPGSGSSRAVRPSSGRQTAPLPHVRLTGSSPCSAPVLATADGLFPITPSVAAIRTWTGEPSAMPCGAPPQPAGEDAADRHGRRSSEVAKPDFQPFGIVAAPRTRRRPALVRPTAPAGSTHGARPGSAAPAAAPFDRPWSRSDQAKMPGRALAWCSFSTASVVKSTSRSTTS